MFLLLQIITCSLLFFKFYPFEWKKQTATYLLLEIYSTTKWLFHLNKNILYCRFNGDKQRNTSFQWSNICIIGISYEFFVQFSFRIVQYKYSNKFSQSFWISFHFLSFFNCLVFINIYHQKILLYPLLKWINFYLHHESWNKYLINTWYLKNEKDSYYTH